MDDTDSLTPAEQAIMRGEGATEAAPETPAEAPAAVTPEKPAEAAAETPAAGEAEPEVQKLVPHGAFEEERQRRKESQKEAQQLREKLAFFEGQKAALADGKKPDGLTEQQKADWDKDPIAAGKALQAELDAQKETAKRQAEYSSEMQRISSIGTRHAEKFAATQPHFFDSKGDDGKPVQGAYTYLRNQATEVIRAQNPGATAQQIAVAVDLAERNHIQTCLQNGDNAAEKLWEMALNNGYAPPVKAAPGVTEAEKIATAEKAQQGGKSLGTVPSGGATGELTLAQIAEMDDDEFAKVDYTKALKSRR